MNVGLGVCGRIARSVARRDQPADTEGTSPRRAITALSYKSTAASAASSVWRSLFVVSLSLSYVFVPPARRIFVFHRHCRQHQTRGKDRASAWHRHVSYIPVLNQRHYRWNGRFALVFVSDFTSLSSAETCKDRINCAILVVGSIWQFIAGRPMCAFYLLNNII